MFRFTFLFPPLFFGEECHLLWGRRSILEWMVARGTWSLWGPASGLDFIPWAPFSSPPPPRGSWQSQTKKGINKKGRSWRIEDPGVLPFPCPVPGASEEGKSRI